jgi:hypothetical protein
MGNKGRKPFRTAQGDSIAEVTGLSERKWVIADLTERAGKEDSEQLSENILDWLFELVSHLVSDNSLAEHPLAEQIISEPTFRSRLIDNITQRVTRLYSYVNSEYITPPDEDKCGYASSAEWNLTLILFSSLTHYMAFNKWHEEYDVLMGSMPRLAFAMKIARTRLKLEYQVLDSDEKNNKAITVQELADLAGVTYMAIRKQLNVKIKAQRKGDAWVIPVETALEYLTKRKSNS